MKYIVFLISFFVSLYSNAQAFDTLVLFQEHSVLFDSDEWKIDPSKQLNLDSILAMAMESDKIVLEGHTDEVGSEEYNQNLSSKRVKSLKEVILAKGFSTENIQSNAFGELIPVKLGSSESAYQLNRRVSIRFYRNQKMRRIHGQVLDTESGNGIHARVKLTGKNFLDSTVTQIDGKYSISAPDKGIYKLEFSAKDHFFEQKFIKISPLDPIEINVELPKIKIGEAYTLPNFNFKGNLPVLLDSSVPTLDQLYDLLANSTHCIEIEGHINLPNRPKCEIASAHYKLSVDRAEMVYKSMMDKGIFKNRMLPKGYGNWRMLFPKSFSEDELKQNRRVEIKVIDCRSEDLLLHHSN